MRFLTFLALLSTFSVSAAKETIHFVTSAYEPYVIENSNTASGILPDLIKIIYSQLGFNAKFEFHSWTQCEELVKQGKAFATFPYINTLQRSKLFNFSDPIIYFFPKFFYQKALFPKGFSWNNLKDFQPYILGGVYGYWYETTFRKLGIEVHYATTDTQNIYKLMHGRIDFTLIDELVGWQLIENTYPGKRRLFAVAKKPESASTFHLMVSRKYPQSHKLMALFNKTLKSVKIDGTYQRIFREYRVPMEYATSW